MKGSLKCEIIFKDENFHDLMKGVFDDCPKRKMIIKMFVLITENKEKTK